MNYGATKAKLDGAADLIASAAEACKTDEAGVAELVALAAAGCNLAAGYAQLELAREIDQLTTAVRRATALR